MLGSQLEEQSHNVVRYAIVMNRVGEVCSDISDDSVLCQELLDVVNTVHTTYLLGKEQALGTREDGNNYRD